MSEVAVDGGDSRSPSSETQLAGDSGERAAVCAEQHGGAALGAAQPDGAGGAISGGCDCSEWPSHLRMRSPRGRACAVPGEQDQPMAVCLPADPDGGQEVAADIPSDGREEQPDEAAIPLREPGGAPDSGGVAARAAAAAAPAPSEAGGERESRHVLLPLHVSPSAVDSLAVASNTGCTHCTHFSTLSAPNPPTAPPPPTRGQLRCRPLLRPADCCPRGRRVAHPPWAHTHTTPHTPASNGGLRQQRWPVV